MNLTKDIQFGKILNDKTKEHFYLEISSLLESGIDIKRALELLIEEQDKEKIKSVYLQIQELLLKGSTFHNALEKTGHFSKYEYKSIQIGEETGRLNNVLHSMSDFFAEKVALKRQLKSVFTYPAFVLSITIGVLYFMMNFVVPMFKDVFKQFGQDLPWLTMTIVWLSEHFSMFIMFFMALIAIVVAISYNQKNELWFRSFTSQLLIKIPIFGDLIRKIYLARFCQSMALLTESKTPLVQSLQLVEEMIRFHPLELTLQQTRQDLLKGLSLHEGLSKSKLIDKRIISLIKIAEEINQLDITFATLYKQLNEEISYRTKMIGTIVEPLIIVIIGSIVGIIMVSMYMPMFNLSNVIK